MNLDDLPEDPKERLAYYQRERKWEQEKAEELRGKLGRGEKLSRIEAEQWAYNRYGGASSHGY